ncbi:urease accessory protein UreH domain-containing protein [Actinomadura montaniterrae]|uniref:Sulfite exporter TauE/SafE family protein n=1 Tax=Actinomadura montaniterrae TaxID=1803903 RepID=A0A6L3VZJ2_9ACTN|nr:sulfite exporter TauE/SafE family protein [Actinomadura montaniterrae]KAB2387942.1 sulfite exporter TauE/SafE family protein [Actinomadura montaniterrae]
MDVAGLFLAGAGAGLLAGGTTCAATQFGLLTGAVGGAAGAGSGQAGTRPVRQVSVFLAAKLASHAALGALLGLVGGAVQPGPRVRGTLLAAAAAVLALFALDLLGFRPVRRLLRRDGASSSESEPGDGGEGCHPPRAGRSGRPVLLGAATVLVPCGLTLSAELLAVTSRSAVGGAVVMAAFVLGTAPLFGLIGVTVGRTMALLRGRLTALLAVALLAVSGWTLLSGLRLGGWLPSGGGATAAADSARFVRTDASGTQVVTIWALNQGYRPALLTARARVHTVLVLRTRHTSGHMRVFTIPSRDKDVYLPATGETRVDLGAPGPGRMPFMCASGHFPGAVTFR